MALRRVAASIVSYATTHTAHSKSANDMPSGSSCSCPCSCLDGALPAAAALAGPGAPLNVPSPSLSKNPRTALSAERGGGERGRLAAEPCQDRSGMVSSSTRSESVV